jgi:hypothetical protein
MGSKQKDATQKITATTQVILDAAVKSTWWLAYQETEPENALAAAEEAVREFMGLFRDDLPDKAIVVMAEAMAWCRHLSRPASPDNSAPPPNFADLLFAWHAKQKIKPAAKGGV